MCSSVSTFFFCIDSSDCPSPPCGPQGPLGTCFVSDHLSSSVNTFHSTRFIIVCCLSHRQLLGLERIQLRDHTLWIQLGKPILWNQTAPSRKNNVGSLMASLLLSVCKFFFKQNEDYPPGFCCSTAPFSYLNSYLAKYASECKHLNKSYILSTDT